MIIMGDFSAKVGMVKEDRVVVDFGLGERNEADEHLIEFFRVNQLIVANTQFEQHVRRRHRLHGHPLMEGLIIK